MSPLPCGERRCDVLVVGDGPGARAAAEAARRAGADVIAAESAWGAFAPDDVGVLIDGRTVNLRPRRLVLALRPVSLPLAIPGWALPGVGTADDELPRGRVVLAGDAGILSAACRAARRGPVAAVVLTGCPGWADARRMRFLARRAVPVLKDALPVRCLGDGRFAALLAHGRGGPLRIEADACVLHGGWAEESGLARVLGATQAWVADGVLRTVVDERGRTQVDGVSVVPGAGPNAISLGWAAGAAAVQALGFRAPRGGGWRAAASILPPRVDPNAFAESDVACPCGQVSAGAVRAALRDGALSLAAVKRATRAGMGRCQGRRCHPTLHALVRSMGEQGFIAPRAPARPIPAGMLMRERTPQPQPIASPVYSRWSTAPAAPAPRGCDALVIGGGIIGLCAALHLARAGVDVALVDGAEPGLGASTANAGSLHVQLLGYDFVEGDPGPLGQALSLGPRSIALWRELARDAGEGFGIRTEGGFVLAADAADMAWLDRKTAFERARGVDTQVVGGPELRAMAPALAERFAGAAFCAAEGQIDPLRATMAVLRLVRAAGVRVVAGVQVRGLEQDGPGWMVRTSGGSIAAAKVLNAAGAHAGVVGRLAGVSLPVRAVVQQVIATAPAPPLLRHLVAQARTFLSLKQGDGGHLLIGGGWPGRLDGDGATRLERESIEGNLWTASRVLPALAGIDVVRAWTGLTVHLDKGPVISGTPGQPGLFHAATANGYTLGPVAGVLVAEAMLGRGMPPAAFALA